MKKALFTLLLFCLGFFISACGGGGSESCNCWLYPTNPTETKIITLSKTAFNINIGKTDNIIVYVNGEDKTEDATFTLVSEETTKSTVATVEKGLITALKAGTAIFKVSYEGAEDVNFTVTAINPALPNLELSKTEINDELGDPTREPEKITVMLNGEDVTDKAIFTSTNENVVTVDKRGNITIVGEGTANIIIHVDGANDQIIPVTVTLSEIENIKEEIPLELEETYNLQPKIKNIDVTDKATFTSSDKSIATVDKNGLITGISKGTITITISVNGAKTKEITVNVDLPTLKLSKKEFTLGLIETENNPTVTLKDEIITDATFTSNDEEIAKIENGIIKSGTKSGTATVTVSKTGANSTTFTVKVNDDAIEVALNNDILDQLYAIGKSAYNASNKTSLTEINIPAIYKYTDGKKYKITSIAKDEFRDCKSLSTVTVEGNCLVDIGNRAFRNTALTSITLPNSLKRIGNDAFRSCESLENFTMPDSVTELGDSAFINCYNLQSITLSKSLLTIGNYAFEQTKSLNNIIIPNGVTSIGFRAFQYSGIQSIDIPNTVTSIGHRAFRGCTNLTNANLPNSITTIEFATFYGCTSLKSFDVPSSVKKIGGFAFLSSGLEEINIPEGVEGIYDGAFEKCISLKNIIIPNSVVIFDELDDPDYYENFDQDYGIGGGMFEGCKNLQSVKLGNGITTLGRQQQPQTGYMYGMFSDCNSLDVDSITIPTSVTTIEYGVMCYLTKNKTSFEIPEHITIIGEYAFCDCSSLTNITIPNSVTSIGSEAFEDCSSLKSITIPDNVTSIGPWTFYGCSSLTNITIPDSVICFFQGSFFGCNITTITTKNGTTITIPNDYSTIGNSTFINSKTDAWNYSSNHQNTNITIPSGVTEIPSLAFNDYKKLVNITIPNTVTKIGASAFGSCTSLTSIDIPNSVTTIGDNTFNSCSSLTSINIPECVTRIGSYAFSGCTNSSLKIEVPESVTNIGRYAFGNNYSWGDYKAQFYYNGTPDESWGGIYLGTIPVP